MVGIFVCFFAFLVLLIIGGGILIFTVGARAVKGISSKEIESILQAWADEHGYQLLQIGGRDPREGPFGDKFGFGKRPGIVKSFEAQDKKGNVRQGWAYLAARMGGRGYSGFKRESLEVRWDQ
jgi:hypothetical protein